MWFSGARSDGPPAIRAVSLSGRERLVERTAPLKINDISRNGRVLVTKGLNLGGITCLIPGEAREREVGWLDFAYVEGLAGRQDSSLGAKRHWTPGVHQSNGRSTRYPTGRRPPRVAVARRQVGAGESAGAPTAWGREWALSHGAGLATIAPARGDHAVGQRRLAP